MTIKRVEYSNDCVLCKDQWPAWIDTETGDRFHDLPEPAGMFNCPLRKEYEVLPGHEKGISRVDAIGFLEEASRYFENRPTNGEDKAYWANMYNANNCRRIIKLLKEDNG